MSTLVNRILAIDEALDRAGIPHAFGGALALAYAIEEPRGTRDIDINIFLPATEAGRVIAALPSGIDRAPESVREAERNGQVRLHWEDNPVDLFFDVHRFHQLAARRSHRVPLAGRLISVLDATDLAVFKALFNRTKDWADIEAMCAVGSLDIGEVTQWLEELVGADDPRTLRFKSLRGH